MTVQHAFEFSLGQIIYVTKLRYGERGWKTDVIVVQHYTVDEDGIWYGDCDGNVEHELDCFATAKEAAEETDRRNRENCDPVKAALFALEEFKDKTIDPAGREWILKTMELVAKYAEES